MSSVIISSLKYFHRGDPYLPDFDDADFIKDSNEYPLDLSALIPSGTKLVCFTLVASNPAANKCVVFKKNGMTYEVNAFEHTTQVGGQTFYFHCEVQPDVDGKISYRFADPNFIVYGFTVRGWWR